MGTFAAVMSTRRPADRCRHCPGIVIVPANTGSSETEVDRLNDPIVANDVELPNIADVCVGRGLPRRVSRIGVSQDQSIRATRPRIELLEGCGHPLRRKPPDEVVAISKRVEHAPHGGLDDERCAVRTRHRNRRYPSGSTTVGFLKHRSEDAEAPFCARRCSDPRRRSALRVLSRCPTPSTCDCDTSTSTPADSGQHYTQTWPVPSSLATRSDLWPTLCRWDEPRPQRMAVRRPTLGSRSHRPKPGRGRTRRSAQHITSQDAAGDAAAPGS